MMHVLIVLSFCEPFFLGSAMSSIRVLSFWGGVRCTSTFATFPWDLAFLELIPMFTLLLLHIMEASVFVPHFPWPLSSTMERP